MSGRTPIRLDYGQSKWSQLRTIVSRNKGTGDGDISATWICIGNAPMQRNNHFWNPRSALPRALARPPSSTGKRIQKAWILHFNSTTTSKSSAPASTAVGVRGCWIRPPVKWKKVKSKKVLTGSVYFFFIYFNYNGNDEKRRKRVLQYMQNRGN